jgi:hypothetical protein
MALNQSPTDKNKLSKRFFVLSVVELTTRVANLVATVVAIGREDLLGEEPAREYVNRCEIERVRVGDEPWRTYELRLLNHFPKLFVLVRIVDQRVSSIEDNIHTLSIGETFEEGSELGGRSFQTTILRDRKI